MTMRLSEEQNGLESYDLRTNPEITAEELVLFGMEWFACLEPMRDGVR